MKIISIVFLVVALVNCVKSYHFVQGNVANRVVLANSTRIQYNAIPFIKRVKMFFYPGVPNRVIQGIQALDNLQSHATVNVTAGGVGSTFVNLRFKSDRGLGLDYDLGIYVNPDYL